MSLVYPKTYFYIAILNNTKHRTKVEFNVPMFLTAFLTFLNQYSANVLRIFSIFLFTIIFFLFKMLRKIILHIIACIIRKYQNNLYLYLYVSISRDVRSKISSTKFTRVYFT